MKLNDWLFGSGSKHEKNSDAIKNPEKIPLIPIGEDLDKLTPYGSAADDKQATSDQGLLRKWFGIDKNSRSSTKLKSGQKIVLWTLVVGLIVLAILAGLWLFKDQVAIP